MIYIGDIVNTHGIKGEVKILSDIEHKELVFKINNKIIVNDEELIIKTYRVHKNFDMVTFMGINDINDVLKYKGNKVYIDKDQIEDDVLFDEDYIGLEVYGNKYIGKVVDVMKNKFQDILVTQNNDKQYLIPKVDEFIKKIDLENKKILINEIKGLIDED